MRDINILLSGSSLEFSSDIKHSHSNSTKNLVNVGDFLQDAGHYSHMNCFGDRSIFYGHEKSKEDMWDGRLQLPFYHPIFCSLYCDHLWLL